MSVKRKVSSLEELRKELSRPDLGLEAPDLVLMISEFSPDELEKAMRKLAGEIEKDMEEVVKFTMPV